MMQPVPQDLLKEYVQSQHFTSTTEIMEAMKEMLDAAVIGTGSVLRTAIIFFYLSNEGVSLLENATHLGLPVPEKLKAVLQQLHDRAEKEDK